MRMKHHERFRPVLLCWTPSSVILLVLSPRVTAVLVIFVVVTVVGKDVRHGITGTFGSRRPAADQGRLFIGRRGDRATTTLSGRCHYGSHFAMIHIGRQNDEHVDQIHAHKGSYFSQYNAPIIKGPVYDHHGNNKHDDITYQGGPTRDLFRGDRGDGSDDERRSHHGGTGQFSQRHAVTQFFIIQNGTDRTGHVRCPITQGQ
mmetsp:Transcript_21925/g.41514  ORF Transcript_21925/g.41514 Transcript_21925/m.41514 type:complete len:202 (-) Transcript_21925:685-1290(-)